MIGQTDIAVLAFRHPTARMTFYHRRKSPPVLEKYHLFLPFECFAHVLKQQRRKGAVHALLPLQLLDVNWNDFGQLQFLVSFFQLNQRIFIALGGIVPTLHTRRSSTQQRLCSIHRRQHNSCVAGMVAGSRILLLIGILVLLVDDNQSQPLERQEEGRAYT